MRCGDKIGLHRRRRAAAAAALLLAAAGARAEIIDGVAAAVGAEAVTHSEIDRELRLAALFNATEADASAAERRAVLQRLIERRLIRRDMDRAAFLAADRQEVEARMRELRAMRFAAGRDFPAALRHYGLTARECRDFVAEQIDFERYVAFRFKTGLDAAEEEAENYYRAVYAPQQRRLGRTPEPRERVSERIERILIELQADRLLDERVREMRALTNVKILAPELMEPRR